MLDNETFKTVLENAPLVSIDLCIIWDGKILLGKRKNNPLKGFFFTPGARILRNETFTDCIVRLARTELGLIIEDPSQFELMGIWDHFYDHSFFEETTSTHYVNLPHYIFYEKKPEILRDDQHESFHWFDLRELARGHNNFHKYMQAYASWLISRNVEND